MKRTASNIITLFFFAVSSVGFAQQVIPAKGGLIHYTEGKVLVNNQLLEPKFGVFPLFKDSDQIQTGQGRVEMLFGPGLFLRMGENSDLRVVSSKLLNTELELRSGSIIVEYVENTKNNVVVLRCKNMTAYLLKNGLYRLDADLTRFQVYKGKAKVEFGGKTIFAGKGKQVNFNGALTVGKFNVKIEDDLSLWSRRRAGYLAMASLSAARSIYGGRMLTSWRYSDWLWDPYFGMMAYLPFRNYCGFYGDCYWNPMSAVTVFRSTPPGSSVITPTYNPNLGYATVPATSAGTSGTISSSSPPSATAPISRDPGQAGGKPK